jgi:hypothetical protein
MPRVRLIWNRDQPWRWTLHRRAGAKRRNPVRARPRNFSRPRDDRSVNSSGSAPCAQAGRHAGAISQTLRYRERETRTSRPRNRLMPNRDTLSLRRLDHAARAARPNVATRRACEEGLIADRAPLRLLAHACRSGLAGGPRRRALDAIEVRSGARSYLRRRPFVNILSRGKTVGAFWPRGAKD